MCPTVQDPTTQAAELAERILDEVSRADQDWHSIEHWARALAELAERVGRDANREDRRQ
jgi:hypothetical protein